MGFDLAFGGYSEVDPRMGKVVAERLTASREIDNKTGEVVMNTELTVLDIEKCNEANFKYNNYQSQ